MSYFIYILQSEKDNSFYIGFSEHPLKRLEKHNTAMRRYTSKKNHGL